MDDNLTSNQEEADESYSTCPVNTFELSDKGTVIINNSLADTDIYVIMLSLIPEKHFHRFLYDSGLLASIRNKNVWIGIQSTLPTRKSLSECMHLQETIMFRPRVVRR